MEIQSYGHFGVSTFTPAAADYLEYERFLMIDVLKPIFWLVKVPGIFHQQHQS